MEPGEEGVKKGAKITNLPRRGLVRLGFRLPILFYEAHLGGLFGDRLLMLTHTGRKSGKPRRVILEVVRHDQVTGVYTIASGWGEKSDWYRNIIADPRVRVASGGREFAARAVPLGEGEAKIALRVYAHNHPSAFRELARYIAGVRSENPEVLVDTIASSIPLFDLTPED